MPNGLISQQTRAGITISKTIGGFLFVIGLLVVAGSLSATGGVYLYKIIAERQKDALQKEVTELADSLRNEGVNQQMLDLDKKLTSARQVLSAHVASSNIFQLLEENTLLRVRFSSFSFNAESRQADLIGEAAGYSVMAAQVRTFESLPEVERVSFGGLQLGERGLLNFKMGITFSPTVLRWRGVQ